MMKIINNVNSLNSKNVTSRLYINTVIDKRFVTLVSFCIFFFVFLMLTTNAQAQVTWTACAGENNTCGFTGTKVVRYGAGSS
jgi:hypothetical protein